MAKIHEDRVIELLKDGRSIDDIRKELENMGINKNVINISVTRGAKKLHQLKQKENK